MNSTYMMHDVVSSICHFILQEGNIIELQFISEWSGFFGIILVGDT